MTRANSIGVSQFGQDGASKWSSFGETMGKTLRPSMWSMPVRISPVTNYNGGSFSCRRNVAGHTRAGTVRFRAAVS
jgi:hypothetical protein